MDLTITPEQRREYADRVRGSGERAVARSGERREAIRGEVGGRMFDLMTEYFPEEYRERRRADMLRAFGAGLAVGFLGRRAFGYWRR